jgi:predicted anti-sigma-YlaC factor YlaD
MQKDHIIQLLEEGIDDMSQDQLAIIETHTVDCPACRRAYQAAQICRDMLTARVAESIEPSPFFAKRVMAALREQPRQPEISPFLRLWRATAPIFTSMVAAVLILLTLTIFSSVYTTPRPTAPPEGGSVQNLLAGDNAGGDMTDSQVITALSDDSEVIYGN